MAEMKGLEVEIEPCIFFLMTAAHFAASSAIFFSLCACRVVEVDVSSSDFCMQRTFIMTSLFAVLVPSETVASRSGCHCKQKYITEHHSVGSGPPARCL